MNLIRLSHMLKQSLVRWITFKIRLSLMKYVLSNPIPVLRSIAVHVSYIIHWVLTYDESGGRINPYCTSLNVCFQLIIDVS